ncbi:hypothetical protein [Lutibacter sp.]|uniref:hypothetical protein n=1 Tax=Lutibacter sp. TaxID=1925666 RepID=UPI0034A03813
MKKYKRVITWHMNDVKELSRKDILTILILGMIPIINIVLIVAIILDYDVYYEEIKKKEIHKR